MHIKIFSITILFVLLTSAACSPVANIAPTIADTSLPFVTETTETTTSEPVTLTVMAAASLTESFTDLGAAFELQYPGVKVAFNFAGSQALAEQLGQGAEVDVFASASKKYMTVAVDAKRVNANNAKTFVKNRLVVIFPKDNPARITTLADLAKPGIKIDLADQAVPAGQYTLDFLDKTLANPTFDVKFKDKVLANVVSYEENVKAVVTKISLGEADAGIVFVTDITSDTAEKVDSIYIPNELNTIASYPIAPIADSKNADLAEAFVALVLSPEGQAVLAKYNFIPAA